MSIELPEAKIFADQLHKEVRGKEIKSYVLKDFERLQKIDMLNKDIEAFDGLVNGKIESIVSRGKVIVLKLSNGSNLVLAPEYGGKIFYHGSEETLPKKFHLKMVFSDDTMLTVRLTSMGLIFVFNEADLEGSYIIKRDFNPEIPSPLDEGFTLERFSKLLESNNRMLKSVLVGKDAILVGLSNSAFQDIIYRAKLHPKRKASKLSKDEIESLYDSINVVIRERMRLKGKTEFYDLYGNQGGYQPSMGPIMKERTCPACGTRIEKMSLGGGHVYLCSNCQV
jgi:formamidopyrimidine-DNA glycosylase